jgi:hypothetical protein
MALKRKRKPIVDDINFKLDQVAERGVLCTYNTAKVGFVQVSASTSGVIPQKVAGVLMIDVVNKDFNAVPVNFQKLETGLSGYVRLLKQGEMGTDQTAAGAVFGAGSGVYLHNNGKISNVQMSTQNERVGTALSAADTNGFVDVYFEIN